MLNKHARYVADIHKTLQTISESLINPYHDYVRDLAASLTAAKEPDFDCQLIETEFWAAMSDPNLHEQFPGN